MGWRLVPFKGPFFIEKWSGRELEFAKSLFLRRLSRQTGRQVQNQFQSPRKLGYLCMHPAIGSGSSTVEPFLLLQQVVNAIFLGKIAASFNFCESNDTDDSQYSYFPLSSTVDLWSFQACFLQGPRQRFAIYPSRLKALFCREGTERAIPPSFHSFFFLDRPACGQRGAERVQSGRMQREIFV